MSRPYGGISFVLFLFLYFISFAIERTNNSRFGIRIVRKTKQKKFQAVKENDFFDVTSSYAGEGDNCDGKKRGRKRSKETKSRQHRERRKRGVKQTEKSRRVFFLSRHGSYVVVSQRSDSPNSGQF